MESDNFVLKCEQMIKYHIAGRGIHETAVLSAMHEVPRHFFVPENIRGLSYEDCPLQIGYGQTISQPYIVAQMTFLARAAGKKVLEIGTGCGYQAAVLSKIAAEVYSVEIISDLARGAEERLKNLNIENVWVKAGDGSMGWEEHAPYGAILITCAPEQIPQALCDQLEEGGRIVAPVGKRRGIQTLKVFEKKDGSINGRDVFSVSFVPMIGSEEAAFVESPGFDR